MKHDEFAFFNRQLAAMLREGIPLEGALKQLSIGMREGPLRAEVETLEQDLAKGTPLPAALAKRNLPEMYKRMVQAGAAGKDLPGVLTLLADHYERANLLWMRLKGLLVYPVLVVLVSLGLTGLLSYVCGRFLANMAEQFRFNPPVTLASLWMPPIVLGILVCAGIAVALSPRWRGRLRWKVPGFREASLSQLASSLSLMLRNGTPLPEALALAESLEADSPAAVQLAEWRKLTETGLGSPGKWPAPRRPFPPLFLWLVQNGGTDLSSGFGKAAEIYYGRASYRIEMLLYGALPISILLLGQMVVWQAVPLMRSLVYMMNMLGAVGGN
jgi:type II secretory pathway component PulF